MPTPLPGTGSSRRASPLVAGSADAAGGLPDLRPFAESLDDVFWLADPERGELLYVSPAFEAVWGIPCEALHEAPSRWNEALLPADRPRLPEPFFAGRPGDASRELDYRIRRPDGAVRWIRDRRFAWRDAAGHVVRVGGIAEDVTARRQDAAHRDAARMPASEGFLAVIVHELRSPLNAIHGWTHVLRHGGGHAAAQLRALEAIERSVQAQARLIDELLDVQRVLQGALRLDLHEVPLASLLEGAVATCRPQAEARHQKLVLQRPPSMVRLHATASGCTRRWPGSSRTSRGSRPSMARSPSAPAWRRRASRSPCAPATSPRRRRGRRATPPAPASARPRSRRGSDWCWPGSWSSCTGDNCIPRAPGGGQDTGFVVSLPLCAEPPAARPPAD